MKPTSSEVSKSASLSNQRDEEVMDAFCDTLHEVDGTSSSTAAGLSQEVRLEETPDERIAASYAWVDEGLYPRDNEILLATDPQRLSRAMMVNLREGALLYWHLDRLCQ
ncbi:hypothetical protein Dimus_018428 [Dionaea muscipula]